jgi:hypothetical protein
MGMPDHWGGCYYGKNDSRCYKPAYQEASFGNAVFGFGEKHSLLGEYYVYERCNYVSNAAFYKGTLRICNNPEWDQKDNIIVALKESFTSLASGSCFWHGAHTYVGFAFDN